MIARIASAAIVAAGCAAGLATFPRHTIAAMAIAAALNVAASRRAAIATLTALLIVGALGARADTSPRATHSHPRHHHPHART